MRFLKHQVNIDMRDYIIEKVNKPLLEVIIRLAGRYPEPTYGNVLHPNSHILLDIRERFFKDWAPGDRSPLCEALFRVVIVKYEHSPNWRNWLDWLFMMIQKSSWKPFNPNRQMPLWKGA